MRPKNTVLPKNTSHKTGLSRCSGNGCLLCKLVGREASKERHSRRVSREKELTLQGGWE